MTYLISTFLLILVLFTKLYFINFGRGGTVSFLEYLSLIILIGIVMLGTYNYLKENIKTKKIIKFEPKNIFNKIYLVFIFIAIASSFIINVKKDSVLWDAVALYDARAKFMMQGLNITEMVSLSRYDTYNSYYYVLYPPHTSIVHYFWYKAGIKLPVGVIYSMYFTLLIFITYLLSRKSLGLTLSLFLTCLVALNNNLFSLSLAEYTNLPFTLQMFLGIFLLYEYIKNKEKWKLIYGGGLIITSMWIRFLEPLWVGAIVSLFITIFINKKFTKDLLYPLAIGIYGVIEYLSWQNFVNGFGEATKIISVSPLRIVEPLIGLFTGSFLTIFIFFIKSWGLILLVYIYSILLFIFNNKKINFLQLFMFSAILIYFFGLYFVSFQSEWWNKLGDSLIRSSTFMIPISAYVVLEYLHGKKN